MRSGGQPGEWKIVPIASDPATIYRSPDPDQVQINNASLLALPNGRMLVTVDQFGPGVKRLTGPKGRLARVQHWLQAKLFVSNDKGLTWTFKHDFPFCNSLLFRDGPMIYAVGHRGNIEIAKSADGGETWSPASDLSGADEGGDTYLHAPVNVLLHDGNLFLAMTKNMDPSRRGDPASVLAPVVLRASQGAMLTARKSWSFLSPPRSFRDLLPAESLDGFGVPVYAMPPPPRGADIGGKRWAHPIGWTHPHLLRITDPDHAWHDPSGRSLHLLFAAHAHRSNLAALATLNLGEAGAMTLGWQTTPAGKKIAFLPVPGGNLRFALLYDEPSALFWLASHQMRDSMTRPERLPEERPGLPCEERHRLQLSFSRNLVDWCPAAFLDAGAHPADMRCPTAMAVRGGDLHILACSGEASRRFSPHGAVRATLHTVSNFRELVYA